MSESIFASGLRRCLKPGKASNEDVLLMVNSFDGDITAAVNVPNENGVTSTRDLCKLMSELSLVRNALSLQSFVLSFPAGIGVNETSVSAIFLDSPRKNSTHVCSAGRWSLGPCFCG